MIKTIDQYQTIGIIGLAKNTGKTTTLNHLIQYYKHEPLGLTSIGLDGEDIDQVNYLPKPRIEVYPEMIVATAKECLDHTSIEYIILEETKAVTALGKVLLIKVLTKGYIMLAGPTANAEMNEILCMMKRYVKRIFVDGALSRMTFSAISELDGIILATGASFHQEMKETMHKTKHVIDLFRYPKTDLIFDQNTPYIISSDNQEVIGRKKSMSLLKESLSEMNTSLKWVYIKGAITDQFMNMLMDLRIGSFRLISEDPTKFLYNYRLGSVIEKLKIKIEVINTCPLLMITINPYRPVGRSYDADLFENEVKKMTSIPVINVKRLEETYGK